MRDGLLKMTNKLSKQDFDRLPVGLLEDDRARLSDIAREAFRLFTLPPMGYGHPIFAITCSSLKWWILGAIAVFIALCVLAML